MNAWEIVLLVVVCIAFAVAVGVLIYNKTKGKSCCDCLPDTKNSSGCNGCCEHCIHAEEHGMAEKQSINQTLRSYYNKNGIS